jgi:hypothetical protein
LSERADLEPEVEPSVEPDLAIAHAEAELGEGRAARRKPDPLRASALDSRGVGSELEGAYAVLVSALKRAAQRPASQPPTTSWSGW